MSKPYLIYYIRTLYPHERGILCRWHKELIAQFAVGMHHAMGSTRWFLVCEECKNNYVVYGGKKRWPKVKEVVGPTVMLA